MAAHIVISLDSDDEEPPAQPPLPTSCSGAGSSKDAPVELSDDEDAPTLRAGSARPGTAASGSGAIDLTSEDDKISGCGLCGRWPSDHELYNLDECGHIFCTRCVQSYVAKKVSEMLAHEVGCPSCGRQLSIRNVTELAKSPGDEPASKRAKSAMAPWAGGSGGPAAMLARLAGGARGGARARVAGNPAATKRIMKELQAIQKADSEKQGFEVSIPDESDVYTWQVEFFNFERGSALAADLNRVPGKRIMLSVAFSSAFPSAPPYVRVIRPRFAFRTGHVTIGGSICTEMLTNQGWAPTMTMESVLLSIRTNMLVGGARLDPSNRTDYSEIEAQIAFDRMVREHGWY